MLVVVYGLLENYLSISCKYLGETALFVIKVITSIKSISSSLRAYVYLHKSPEYESCPTDCCV